MTGTGKSNYPVATPMGAQLTEDVVRDIAKLLETHGFPRFTDEDTSQLCELEGRRPQELKTPPVFWPPLLAIKARAHALAGRVAEGLVLVDEALELAASGDTSSIPELSLLKGRPAHRGWRRQRRRGALVPWGVRWCR